MTHPVENRHIVLGVTGSISAYKAAEIASRLKQAGALVDVILTQAATQFITPLTFQSVTGRKAYVEADLWGGEGHVTHIGLGHNADLLLIAPASANTLAKLAHGIGDNLLTVTALAAHCPLLIAPAMDAGMYSHPATQANVELLKQRGAIFIGPAEGHLASGLVGLGRLVEPQDILGQVRYLLSRNGPLKGVQVVVSAGGTQEAIDPVRLITNRSSGKQGYAVAQTALDYGAEVVLVSAPTALSAPTDTLYHTNLPNVRGEPGHYGSQRVCLRYRPEMLEGVPLAEAVPQLLEFFWSTGFNQDIANSAFGRAMARDPRLASLEAWETASRENPLFVLEVDWEPADRDLPGLWAECLMLRGETADPIATAEELADILYRLPVGY